MVGRAVLAGRPGGGKVKSAYYTRMEPAALLFARHRPMLLAPHSTMMRESPRPHRAFRRGFTLVEIMVVVVIIGLLAALAIPAFQRNRRSSQNTRAVNDFRVFAQAFEIYNTQNGAWPDSASPGALPTLPAPISDSLRASNWQSATSLGGQWQWEINLSSSGNAGVCISGFTCMDDQLGELDAKLDDGNLNTGRFRKISASQVIYILATGT